MPKLATAECQLHKLSSVSASDKRSELYTGVLATGAAPWWVTQSFHPNNCTDVRNKSVFSYLHMLTTWHCPQSSHSHAAAAKHWQCSNQSVYTCAPGPQQQTCSSGFAAVGPCWDRDGQTDRLTDTVAFHRPCCAYYDRQINRQTPDCCFILITIDKASLTVTAIYSNTQTHARLTALFQGLPG